MRNDFMLAGLPLASRFLLGTAGYPSPQVLRDAIEASGAQVVTLGLKRQLAGSTGDNGFIEIVRQSGARLLPNTAGCRSAREAITLAHMARELLGTHWIKLEVVGDEHTLQPDPFELVGAAEQLVKDGFEVFPYCTDDLVTCRRLLDAGCRILMPWGAPIGSGQGLLNPWALRTLRSREPDAVLIVDAGIGTPSHAAQAMELGYDAVLLNSAVAHARDPVAMARAFAHAIEAGRLGLEAGLIAAQDMAVASTPVAGAAVMNPPVAPSALGPAPRGAPLADRQSRACRRIGRRSGRQADAGRLGAAAFAPRRPLGCAGSCVEGAGGSPRTTVINKRIVWSIAGSDSSGGAGLQADLKAFDAFDVHGCSAVAALTAQHSRAVERIEAVSPQMLDAQLAALASDLPPAAIKTGMLGSAENLRVVARWVDRLRVPLVVDPVLRATTGASFADEALLDAYRSELLPRATLVTPNVCEAAALLGAGDLRGEIAVEQAARALRQIGTRAVVITGGDAGGSTARDHVHCAQASGWLALPRIATSHHHGTGCVHAASAAAALALGFVEIEAAVLAKMSTAHALRRGYAAGRGAGPVRPGAGFALQRDDLPSFDAGAVRGFAALAERELGLYAIVDSAQWVERVLAAGVRAVQLRIKDGARSDLSREIRASVAAARIHGAQLFINDHWMLAIEHGAYGVHLGQDDLPSADLAAIRASGLRLGVSTHALWEVCRAAALQPSYIACGPIHATQLKAMPWTPQGEDNLAYWCSLLDAPVVAIGGMDAGRAREAMRCGAAGVAVVGAISRAPSPAAATAALQQAVDGGSAAWLRGDRRAAPALPRPTLSTKTAFAGR